MSERISSTSYPRVRLGTFYLRRTGNKSSLVKYLPAWCLGAGFQREAREWRKYAQAMLERPTEAVKKAMKEGTARPSMMISLLDGLSGNEDPRAEWIMSSAAATAYEGQLL